MMGSFQYYITNEQMKAMAQNAPIDATYYSDRDKRWHTFGEIANVETKERVLSLLR